MCGIFVSELSFYIFQGDLQIHIIYKSVGQEEISNLFAGKWVTE